MKVTVQSLYVDHCVLTRARAPSCTVTTKEKRMTNAKEKLQCRKRKHVVKRENEACEIRKLSPTHEKPSQLLKPWVRQRFCERISKLKGCVNLLNHHNAILDSISKMMPFDANVFHLQVELIQFVCKFQTTSIVFENYGLVHVCVNCCVLCKSNIGRDTKVTMFSQFSEKGMHRK